MLKRFLKNLAERCGYRITQIENTQFFHFESLLYYHLSHHKYLTFVQIGGCDGISFDPLHAFIQRNRSRVRGVIVEPLSDFFKQLQHAHRDHQDIVLVNCAIHNTMRQLPLYRVDPSKLKTLPDFARGISSFDSQHYLRSGIPADAIIEESVPCRTLHEVIQESGLANVDLLITDTEGYDAEILLGMNFEKLAPSMIHFEHGLEFGTMSPESFRAVVDRLHQYGYELCFTDADAIAYRREMIVSLRPPATDPA